MRFLPSFVVSVDELSVSEMEMASMRTYGLDRLHLLLDFLVAAASFLVDPSAVLKGFDIGELDPNISCEMK